MDRESLIAKARTLPVLPGVYLFKGETGAVLYVGKSVALRHRVLSYFHESGHHTPRIQWMVDQARDLEFFVTDTPEEALVLEYELINRHSPPFNVVFRDDKSYPCLKVTDEEFPRIVFTRRPREGEGEVLGPFPSADSLRRTLRWMRTVFPVRGCSFPSAKLRGVRACLDYHIKRCPAPCEGRIDASAYQAIVRDAVLFLKGRDTELVDRLRAEMREAASGWRFEDASRLKHALSAFERVRAKQEVSSPSGEDLEVLAVAAEGAHAAIVHVKVREGRIAGQAKSVFERKESSSAEVLGEFVKLSFLGRERATGDEGAFALAREIVISEPLPEQDLIGAALERKLGGKVTLHVPRRGRKRGLVAMALKNAHLHLAAQASAMADLEDGLEELAEALELPRPPETVECFDISHLGGQETVASMVVARAGRMDRSRYRRFRIRGVDGIDDFASMREVVTRRYGKLVSQKAALPDLVLLDGGKGQLSAGMEALLALGLVQLPIAALAKREEILFAPRLPDGLALPENSPARRLVQRIRDEAHRFAITYHRTLRSKRTVSSALDAIDGIGPRTRTRLLVALGSVERIRDASLDDLAAVKGVTRRQAQAVWQYFHASSAETAGPSVASR